MSEMLKLLGDFVASGVQAIGLLALNDEGAPSYDHGNAQRMADLGIPVFACTPDLFPDLMAAAISRRDLEPVGRHPRHRHRPGAAAWCLISSDPTRTAPLHD